MMEKMKNLVLCLLFTVFLLPAALYGQIREKQEIRITPDRASLSRLDGTVIIQREGSRNRLSLSPAEYKLSEESDLLLHFNRVPFRDAAGGYDLIPGEAVISRTGARLGQGAAFFRGGKEGLEAVPRPGSFLSGDCGLATDFSIEFWLKPSMVREGETVFLWKGARKVEGEIIPQEIRCYLEGGRLVWDFINIFMPPEQGRFRLRLEGRERLLPGEWNHHLLRFDAGLGFAEYLLNGIPSASGWATATGREDGRFYQPCLGNTGKVLLLLGPGLTGYLDEMRLTRRFVRRPGLRSYPRQTGWAETGIYDLGYTGSLLEGITVDDLKAPETAIQYDYRLSDDIFAPDDTRLSWRPLRPGDTRALGRGRFFQLRVSLSANGTGSVSPLFYGARLVYSPDFPPRPPRFVRAEAGDGRVTLEWSPVTAPDVAGYLVYYGTEPGVYWGRGLVQGDSPLDAGNRTEVELTGLENGRLYFFSVVTYDSARKAHHSSFSGEVSVRPTALGE